MEQSIKPIDRAGQFITQPTGYKAFIPRPLPPEPPLNLDAETVTLLSQADRNLGRLDGLASIISDPDLFVYLYVRKEALLSSQIEGTQCSLEDVLGDADQHAEAAPERRHDIEEVSNYVNAMNQGLARLKDLPISTRLIREIHAILMQNVRGSNKTPGEFRVTQNWIGSPDANLSTAAFVPPPPQEVGPAMGALEKYIHSQDFLPPLIRAALVHAQFETIHPFLDGNGRLGRLLITFVLCNWGVIGKPLLYLSYYFKAHRSEYYARLMDIRTRGDWESWVKFFLRGVNETALMANQAALDIHQLHARDAEKLRGAKATQSMLQVFHLFCRFPAATIPGLVKAIPESNPMTLGRAVDKLVKLGILKKMGPNQRNRRFVYREYLDVLTRDTTTQMG